MKYEISFKRKFLLYATVFFSNVLEIRSQHKSGVSQIEATFIGDERTWNNNSFPSQFNHLAVDKNTGFVYVGAVNNIYQLNANLELLVDVITGPKDDSVYCRADYQPCLDSNNAILTNNVNKALVIDNNNSALIACGTLFRGQCTVRSLENIQEYKFGDQEIPVVSNNPTASTIAFIATGPNHLSSPGSEYDDALYVGVTYTPDGPFRSEVPAISTRILRSDDRKSIFASHKNNQMFFNSLTRENFPINYVYGFSSEGFAYFLTTQKKEMGSSNYGSKIVRVCQNSENYNSYAETPLECANINDEENPYNLIQSGFVTSPGPELAKDLNITTRQDVLFAVFSNTDKTIGAKSNKPGKESALCVFSLHSIRKKFTENISQCFNGVGMTGLDFITTSKQCIKVEKYGNKTIEIDDDFCGLDVNTPFGGELPVVSEPIITFETRLTSVIATTISEFSVSFVGTEDGHLKKIAFRNTSYSLEYEDIVIDEGKPVNSDMAFDPGLESLYVMTEKKLSKVLVQYCPPVSSCLDCLTLQNPFCGWCSSKNTCSNQDSCVDHSGSKNNWLDPFNSTGCPFITSIIPNQVSVRSSRVISIKVDNLQPYDENRGNISCNFFAFGSFLEVSSGTKGSELNEILCSTPRPDKLERLRLNPGDNHFLVDVRIRIFSGNHLHAEVSDYITFYDCRMTREMLNEYTTKISCSSCVSSDYPCNWCVNKYTCTDVPYEDCKSDIIVNGVNHVEPSIRPGPNFCPAIHGIDDIGSGDNSSEIMMLSGTKQEICYKVLFSSALQVSLSCSFYIDGRDASVDANLKGDKICCDEMEFLYDTCSPNVTAQVFVKWGGYKYLENPTNVKLVLYKNQKMIKECGK